MHVEESSQNLAYLALRCALPVTKPVNPCSDADSLPRCLNRSPASGAEALVLAEQGLSVRASVQQTASHRSSIQPFINRTVFHSNLRAKPQCETADEINKAKEERSDEASPPGKQTTSTTAPRQRENQPETSQDLPARTRGGSPAGP